MLPAHTHVVPEPTLARAQSQADTLSACPSHASSARTPRAGPPNTMQLYRTLFVFLAVVLAMAAAEEAAPDPCLAEECCTAPTMDGVLADPIAGSCSSSSPCAPGFRCDHEAEGSYVARPVLDPHAVQFPRISDAGLCRLGGEA